MHFVVIYASLVSYVTFVFFFFFCFFSLFVSRPSFFFMLRKGCALWLWHFTYISLSYILLYYFTFVHNPIKVNRFLPSWIARRWVGPWTRWRLNTNPFLEGLYLIVLVYDYCALWEIFYLNVQSNLDSSSTDGSFTMANSNSFLSPYVNSSDSWRKQIFREIFSFYHDIVCCLYSLESLIEAILMNTFNIQLLCIKSKRCPKLSPFASWSDAMINLQGSNYQYLEQISMIPKMFEPLKFDCILCFL